MGSKGRSKRKRGKEYMKIKKVLLLTLFAILASATPAMANMAPGPQEILPEVLIIIFLIALTAIGGGYAIITKKTEEAKGKRSRNMGWAECAVGFNMGWAWCVVGFILAMILSAGGFTLLFVIAFGVWAVVRGGAMICWGLKARSSKRPAYLEGASPKRLIPSGTALVVISVFLVSAAFVFSLFSMHHYMENRRMSTELKKLTAVEIARMLPHEELTAIITAEVDLPMGVKAKKEPFTVEEALERLRLRSEELSGSPLNVRPALERDVEKKSFTIHLPSKFLVPFPYSLMGGESPTYRADYVDNNDYEAGGEVSWEARVGTIKRCSVKRKDERCAATEQAYKSVKEEDVLRVIYETIY